jgi:hypothetical protein
MYMFTAAEYVSLPFGPIFAFLCSVYLDMATVEEQDEEGKVDTFSKRQTLLKEFDI